MVREDSVGAGVVGHFSPAPDMPSFLKSLENHYYASEHFAFWVAAGGFSGITVWGQVTEEDARALRYVIEAVLDTQPQQRWPNRTSLLDATEVIAVEPKAFEIMTEHFVRQDARAKGRPVRQAMVRPPGFVGSIVAGFFSVAPPPFETSVFTSVRAAMEWLGRSDAALAGDIDRLRELLTQSASELTALRQVLTAHISGITLEAAARRLGVSPRTLQRKLRAAGTTFQAQWNAAQVGAARLLLTQTSDKVAAIARAVGCSSAAQLSTLFRRLTGETPSEFRERTRQALRTEPPRE